MRKFAIILAGGEGRRAGGDMPKQFRRICGHPVVWWPMKAFHDADAATEIVLVVHPGFFADWQMLFDALPESERLPYTLCCGGRSRAESVKNGLLTVAELLADAPRDDARDAMVMVHDGARPLISPHMIRRGIEACTAYGTGVIPAMRAVNSLREVADPSASLCETDSHTVSRDRYVEVQTPQIFPYTMLSDCYARATDHLSGFTDDASVVENAGHSVRLYEGEARNIKVTHPDDFIIAEALLKASADN
ncbi:MAG: 2-C-methyl-D-erythritol 4-phosphate cytidylyltransferase [Muribaculaceae bacterium]|nr:2-C-methyl-D-erythritol 4-phosphate cytidylyltransferase [Muribaculaceae bacterium]